jgi:hypothetical protein
MALDNELRVSITADTAGLQSGLTEAQSEVAASSDAIASSAQTAAASTTTLAQAQTAAAAAAKQLAAAQEQLGAAAKAGSAAAQEILNSYAAEAAAADAAVAALTEHTVAQEVDTKATYNRAEAMGVARVSMGAMSGSLGSMEMGLARMAAGSQVLGPLLNNLIPIALFAAGVEIIYDVGKAIYTAFDMGGEAAAKLRGDLAETGLSWRELSDSTQVEIDKLDAANAKLEHVPNPNAQYEAIHLASLEADKLDQQLSGLLTKEEKITAQFGAPQLKQVLTMGMGGTGVKYEDTLLQEHIRHLDEATTAQQINDEELRHAASLQTRLKELQQWQATGGGPGIETDYSNEIAATEHLIAVQQKEMNQVQLMNELNQAKTTHEALTGEAKTPKAATDNLPEQIAKASIEAQHAADAQLDPMQQILGTLDKEIALNAVNAQYSKEGTAQERAKLQALKDEAATAKAVAEVNRAGSEELARTNEASVKAQDEAERQASEEQKRTAEEWKRNHEEQIAMAKQTSDAEIKAADDLFESTKRDIAMQEELGKISHRTATKMLLDAQKLKEQTTQGSLKKVTELYDPNLGQKELAEFQQAENKMTQEARKASLERQQIERREQQQFIKEWKQVTNEFNRDFTQAFNSWMTHSESAGKAFGSMLGELERQTIDFVAMYLLKKAEMWAMDEAMQLLGITKEKTAQDTAATQQIASNNTVIASNQALQTSTTAIVAAEIALATATTTAASAFAAGIIGNTAQIISNVTLAESDQGLAAAEAALAAAPEGVLAAIAAGSETYAAFVPWTTAAGFSVGGIVPGSYGAPMPAIVHAGERVLTASQNTTYEQLANSSTRASSVRLHYNPVIHGNADAGMLQEHSRQILSQVSKMIRPEARV